MNAALADETYLTHAVLDRLQSQALAPRAADALSRVSAQVTTLAANQGLAFSQEDIQRAAQAVLAQNQPLSIASEKPGEIEWAHLAVDPESRAAALATACRQRPWWLRWLKAAVTPNVWDVAKHLGITIDTRIWKIHGHQGYSSWVPPKGAKPPLVMVDSEQVKQITAAQFRFHVAHQLGHLLLGHPPASDGYGCDCRCRLEPGDDRGHVEEADWPQWRPGATATQRVSKKATPPNPHEEAADRFAGALLIPLTNLARQLAKGRSIAQLAHGYDVPVSVMRQRLVTLAHAQD